MASRTINLTDALYDHLLEVSLREPEILARLREETAAHPASMMQISPEQGQFMTLVVELIGARRVLEIGTFTGYSALAMAHALPDDGQLIACDISEEFTSIARRYWAESDHGHKIELRLAPALETLEAMLEDGHHESFDLVFIDADKENYAAYAEHALALLRQGGLMMVDNVLWGGKVADHDHQDDDTRAIRALNKLLHQEERVTLSMIPMGDGITLARKR
ncbi:MAG: class I SAM-dependent methyltransferase [Pseudomonadota bacterium]